MQINELYQKDREYLELGKFEIKNINDNLNTLMKTILNNCIGGIFLSS
jgi:hypothetical protein